MKIDIGPFVRAVKRGLVKHGRKMAIAGSIVGFGVATVLVAEETPVVVKKLEEKKKEKQVEKLDAIDIVTTAVPVYAPAAGVFAASTAGILCGVHAYTKENAALSAACAMSETALKTYREKVVESVGEKKEQEIQEQVAVENVKKAQIANPNIPVYDAFFGKKTMKCFEPLSNSFFFSDRDTIMRVMNDLNRDMRDSMDIVLNDWLSPIGARLLGSDVGEAMGWNIDSGYIDIHFGSCLDENDIPCLSIVYNNPPRYLKAW